MRSAYRWHAHKTIVKRMRVDKPQARWHEEIYSFRAPATWQSRAGREKTHSSTIKVLSSVSARGIGTLRKTFKTHFPEAFYHAFDTAEEADAEGSCCVEDVERIFSFRNTPFDKPIVAAGVKPQKRQLAPRRSTCLPGMLLANRSLNGVGS